MQEAQEAIIILERAIDEKIGSNGNGNAEQDPAKYIALLRAKENLMEIKNILNGKICRLLDMDEIEAL